MAKKMTHPAYPPVTFAELLKGLIGVITDTGFQADGVSVQDMQTMLADQETQDSEDRLAEARYVQSHNAFLEAQAARFALYMQVLEMMRGRFRRNRAIRERLNELKLKTGRKGPKGTPADGTPAGEHHPHQGKKEQTGTEPQNGAEAPKPPNAPEGTEPPKA